MTEDFRFLMIGAMYENGGNTTHRFLDGHPELFVYPFESQLGTRLVSDSLSSMFPVKYRWPTFALGASPQEDYAAIIDEECKVRARTPQVSKFRHFEFDFSDDDRREIFCEIVQGEPRGRASNVAAFFQATFEAWKNYRRSGGERVYVGYSPIVGVDGDKILEDLPGAHVLHVVRNPWSAYADTKKRPVPLGLATYLLGWTVCQYHALLYRRRYPDRFHIVRAEDVMADSRAALGGLCKQLGVSVSDSLATPSWNGRPLEHIYPWGTIRTPTTAANLATAAELSSDERKAIADHAWQYVEAFGYEEFLETGTVSPVRL